jgi:hypothetical protein
LRLISFNLLPLGFHPFQCTLKSFRHASFAQDILGRQVR